MSDSDEFIVESDAPAPAPADTGERTGWEEIVFEIADEEEGD